MRRGAGAVGVAVVFTAVDAAAEGPGDARLAQALFEEARSLMDQKRFAEACPKLKESQRLDPGGGTLLNLASCHAGEGKTATALDEYHEALTVATRDGRKDREQIARTRITELEREVPRVTVLVPHAVPGIEVKLDTTTLVQAAWGVSTPVDPGPHTVGASAAGYSSVLAKFDVHPNERKIVEVPPQKKEEVVTSTSEPATPRDAPPPRVWVETRANPVFWAMLGTGLTALAVSSVTGILTISNTLNAKNGCIEKRDYCRDQDSADSVSSARTFGWVSTISLGVSVAAFIATLALPSKKMVAVARNGNFELRF